MTIQTRSIHTLAKKAALLSLLALTPTLAITTSAEAAPQYGQQDRHDNDRRDNDRRDNDRDNNRDNDRGPGYGQRPGSPAMGPGGPGAHRPGQFPGHGNDTRNDRDNHNWNNRNNGNYNNGHYNNGHYNNGGYNNGGYRPGVGNHDRDHRDYDRDENKTSTTKLLGAGLIGAVLGAVLSR